MRKREERKPNISAVIAQIRAAKRSTENSANTEPAIGKRSTESSGNIGHVAAPLYVKDTKIYISNDITIDTPVYYWEIGARLPEPPLAFTIKLKHNGEWIEYKRLYCGFDIETTNVNEKDRHLAFMYHWQFCIASGTDGFVMMGRTWPEFLDFMEQLRARYDLNDNSRLICWIANAGFEFQFMRKYFDWDPEDFFAREERHPMKARTGGFEFHEALTISGGSLAQLAKDYTHTQKLKGDLDYSIPRNSSTLLSVQEQDYCINDVVILAEWSRFIFDNYIIKDKRIPLTKTGILRSETRMQLEADKGRNGAAAYRQLIYEAFPDEETYNTWFHYLFRGGYVHSNCLMSGFTIYGADGYDITSSYPKEMLFEAEYPLTPFVKCDFNPELLKTKCCIMTVRFKDIRRRWAHSIESKSKVIEIANSKKTYCVYDNGRIAQAGSLTVMLTSIDWELYNLFYTWDGVEILDFYTAEKGFLPLFIRKTLAKYYKLKAQLKKSGKQDTPEYIIAKQKVNSFFGMMVTRIELDKISYNNLRDMWDVSEKALDFGEEIKSMFLLPQWGIWVTALGRRSLLTVTAAVTEAIGDGSGDNGAGVIYNDTDSIKVYDPDGKAREIIERYNEQIEAKRAAARLTSPEFGGLGQYDFEVHYDRFKTLGAKRYLTEEHGKVKATIAGLPKQSILKADGDPFELFDMDGMLLDADVSLKKTISYNDEPSEAYVNGELMHEESSAGIYDISFTMNLDKAYYAIITAGLTERVRKYGD